MSKLLDAVPSWAWIAIVAALTFGCFLLKLDLAYTETLLAHSKTELAQVRGAHEKAARERSEAYRKIDQVRAKVAQEVEDAVAVERRKTAAAVDNAAVASSKLRNVTLELARERGRPDDPTALRRAEARAEAFGELLVQCYRVSEGLGREAEDLATQVRGLQWRYQSLIDSALP